MTIFKIIFKLYNDWGRDDPRGTCLTYEPVHLIMMIKNIFGLCVGISTIFKISISKLYKGGGGGKDPRGTCLII